MSGTGTNRLLSSLPAVSRREIISLANLVELPLRTVLSDSKRTPEFSYFMLSGIASEVVELASGEVVEIGLVGPEGVTGTYHLLGKHASVSQCFIQIEGTAYRLPTRELERLFNASAAVRSAILEYVQHQMAHLGQTAACNRVHDAGPRFARWLLTIQDRSQVDEFALTQQFLAQMLGTGRPTVSIIAKTFEKKGLLAHRRGRIRIVDRLGLAAIACACYEATRGVLVRLYE